MDFCRRYAPWALLLLGCRAYPSLAPLDEQEVVARSPQGLGLSWMLPANLEPLDSEDDHAQWAAPTSSEIAHTRVVAQWAPSAAEGFEALREAYQHSILENVKWLSQGPEFCGELWGVRYRVSFVAQDLPRMRQGIFATFGDYDVDISLTGLANETQKVAAGIATFERLCESIALEP